MPDGVDLEAYICSSSLRPIALKVAKEFEPNLDDDASDEALAAVLGANKPIWARRFGENILKSPPRTEDIPEALEQIRKTVIEHETENAATSNA